jgi:hypothetical protein
MSGDAELDTEALRAELETIKGAMGLGERYESQFHLWLVYGVLVGLASLGSQAVVLYGLPGWGHWLSWGGFMALGVLYQAVALDGSGSDRTTGADARPNIGLTYLAVFGYAVAVLAIAAPLFEGVGGAVASSTIFAVFVGAVGLAYLLAGNSLKAYYIRRRDRYAFYAGGVWILALAVLIPRIGLLQRWGYAAFGVAFAVHAVASYLYLR